MNTTNKIFLLIIFAISISNTLIGQPLIGGHLGLNFSSLSGDKDNDETNLRIGVSPGLIVDFPLNHMLTIETGVSFSMQGMQRTRIIKEDLSVFNTKTKYNLDYLVVPVYLKENFTNFYAKIGPYGAYLANAQEKWETTENTSGVITEKNGTNLEFQESLTPYDIGISIGFGYIHYFQNRRRRRSFRKRRTTRVMQVDLKYNLGLVSLNNPELDMKNRVFSIGLSINQIID
ncbi:MAG: porin family protein [Bacteroidota bacterium]